MTQEESGPLLKSKSIEMRTGATMTVEEQVEALQIQLTSMKSKITAVQQRSKTVMISGVMLTIACFFCLAALAWRNRSAHSEETMIQSITTQRLSLVNERGEEYLSMGSLGHAAGLSIRDKNGTQRAALIVSEDGVPSLLLGGEKENELVKLMVLPGGAPFMAMYDNKGATRIMLAVDAKENEPQISLWDENRNPRLMASIRKDDVARLEFLDPGRVYRATLSVAPQKNSMLRLYDPRGNGRLIAAADQDNEVQFHMLDADGTLRLGTSVDAKGDIILGMANKRGEPAAGVAVTSDGRSAFWRTNGRGELVEF